MTMEKVKKAGELCFWIALFTEILLMLIDKSAYINPYEGILFRLTFALFCIKIITTKYSKTELICIAVVGGIAAISYFINTRDEAVRAVALVVACKDIDLKKMLKFIFVFTSVGVAVIFLLSVTGIYGDISVTADFGRGPTPAGKVETRYCFGMGHPNAFQTMIFMVSMLFVYIYIDSIKLYNIAIVVLINIASYLFTDSNTALLVMIAFILGVLLLKYCRVLRESKILYILSGILVVFLTIFSIYGSHVGRDTPVMYWIDKALNGRFQYSNIFEMARVENWTLFALPDNVEFFDQGFIRLFYWYGIIPAIVFLLGIIYLIWISYKKKDYVLLVFIVANAVFMIMEAHIISVYLLRNYLLIFMGYYWNDFLADSDKSKVHV